MGGRLTDRMLAWLGLDLDYTIDFGRDPFNRITEDLYLGGRPERTQVNLLNDAKITHVVSCLEEGERDKVAFLQDSFQALFLPLRDGMHQDITPALSAFFDFVDAAKEHDAGARFLVHCQAGVSRSATLVTALVMRRSRQRFFDAYRDVRTKRAEVLPNIGFASQLQRFEIDLGLRTPGDPNESSLTTYLREVCKVPVEPETLQQSLHRHNYDAVTAIQTIFGDEIPRVVQGVRL